METGWQRYDGFVAGCSFADISLFGTPAVVIVVVLGPTDVYCITQCQSGNECMGSDGGLWALVATDGG